MPSHYDRDALLTAAMRNAQATQDQLGLDERYDRAAVLRDDPYGTPTFANAGVVSPLSVLATTANRATGRKQMREVGPLRKSNRDTIGETAGLAAQADTSIALNEEDRAALAAKEDTTRLKHTMDMERKAQKLAEDELKFNQGTLQGSPKRYVNKNDKNDEIMVVEGPQGNLMEVRRNEDGTTNLVPLGPDYVEAEDQSFRYKALSRKDGEALADDASGYMDIKSAHGKFKKEYVQPNELPTSVFNRVLAWTQNQDLLGYVSDDMSANEREAALWWGEWHRAYTLMKRHKWFGATLTNNEMKSWTESVGLLQGMNPDQAQQAIDNVFREVENGYKRRLDTEMRRTMNHEEDFNVVSGNMRSTGGKWNENTGVYWGDYAPGEEPPTPEEPPLELPAEEQSIVNSLQGELLDRYNRMSNKGKMLFIKTMMRGDIKSTPDLGADPGAGPVSSVLHKATRSTRGKPPNYVPPPVIPPGPPAPTNRGPRG